MKVLIILILLVGYCLNIYKLFNAGALAVWTFVEIIRVIGLFIPFIGGVVGYF